MLDRKLGNAKSFGVRQHRREAMELAVKADVFGHILAVRLESAIEVMQLDTGCFSDGPVEHFAWRGFAEGILAALFPAGNEIIALVEFGEKAGKLVGIVLQVAIHRDDDISASDRESVGEALGFAEVAAMAKCSDAAVLRAKHFDLFPGAVFRTVVDKEQLKGDAFAIEHLKQTRIQRIEIAFFVVDRDDDAEQCRDGGRRECFSHNAAFHLF